MKSILMLEDESDRIQRFQTVLQEISPTCELQIWNRADDMIRELPDRLASADLLSLDHDLVAGENEADPGNGYDVVRFLVTLRPRRPVIVHSSNGERSSWMLGELQLANWKYWRVAPIGDDWIELDWRNRIIQLMRKQRKRR